ncbi:MAG: cadherin-like domain-containing protein [Rhodospirillales bacterium]|nr:cadherin-like domain-containing protein [Rhodospirillales bacterium]
MSDNHGAASTATVAVTVTGTNDGPVAVADVALAYEDSSLTIHAANLLANDRDIDGDTLSISAIDTAATLGQVVDNGDGTFGYTPGAAFQHLGLGEVATDSFIYTVSDGHGGLATATVYVTVKGANDRPVAVADNIVTAEDAAVTFSAAALLANDSDVDVHDSLSILSIDASTTRGGVVDNGDGTFSYDPATAFQYLAEGESATDTFTYTVSDGHGGTARTTVTMLVTGSNDGPVAVADSLAVGEDAALTFSAADLLANDSDADASDVLTITAIDSTATLGSLVDNGDDTYTYDPGMAFQHLAEGETATDSFSYTVSDGHGGVAVATVTMTITGANDAPVVVADNLGSVDAYSFVSISASQLLANDFDVDSSDTLSIVSVGNAVNGQVVMSDAGQILFQPDLGYAGAATFEYTVSDGHGGLSTATATLQSILPANLILGTDKNDKLKGDKKANIIDGKAGDDKISAKDAGDILVGGAGNDELEGGKGNDVFLVSGKNSGFDEFEGGKGFDRIIGSIGDDIIGMREFEDENSVEEIDGGLGLNVIQGTAKDDELDFSNTVLKNINAIDGGAGDDEITGSAAADTIFGGDGADNIEGGAGNDVISGGAGDDELEGGAGDDTFLVSGQNDGFDEYKGGSGFDQIIGSAGDDVIGLKEFEDDNSVELIDGGTGYNVIQGSSKSDELDFSHTVLSHIDLIDGGDGNDEITGSAGRDIISGGQGNDRINGGAGTDTAVFTGNLDDYKVMQRRDGAYVVRDMRHGDDDGRDDKAEIQTDGQDVIVDVERLQFADRTMYLMANQGPAATSDDGRTYEDAALTIPVDDLLANDTDPDGDGLFIEAIGNAYGGAVSFNANGDVVFMPDADFSGEASFDYVISDGHGGTSMATVTVAVEAVADAPKLLVMDAAGNEDVAIALDITSALTDVDGSEFLSITIDGVPAGASLSAGTDNGDCSWTLDPTGLTGLTITPPTNFSGTFDLTVTATSREASNGDAASTSATLSVDVNAAADVPMLTTASVIGTEDTVIALDIVAYVTDVDNSESLSIAIDGVPEGAILSAGTDNGNGSWTLDPVDLVGLLITPPMDYNGAFTLAVTVTAVEAANGSAAAITNSFDVKVTPVADVPDLVVSDVVGDVNMPVILDIAAQLTDMDGSEGLAVLIEGVPGGLTLSAGVQNADGAWEVPPGDLAGISLMASRNFTGTFDLRVSATATEETTGVNAIIQETMSVFISPQHAVILTGDANVNILVGGVGDDILIGGGGNDTLMGNGGADTYVFDRGDGQDVINATGGASADKVVFRAGVNHDQLWFQRSGSDLVVSVIGCEDQVAVQGWFDSADKQVAAIKTADGYALDRTVVENLVNAMAGMTPPPVGQTNLSDIQNTQLSPVLAANWQPR